ncbi:CAF17-like 4Fe-4S cluster assembly/insertion protein YgfZ [Sphingomonas bacterium]|uniref:CAF17-like 4Fe-4S cluster assembly/insertion protein YgfZ n=1 Tax=Sphingomonas bacterium TaxID=1895847 RepID=UPI0015762D3D|nr:folate-binding protein [Sphingomonas bacterium]
MPATMLADRALIRLSGEDVRGFLQGLVTNEVAGALPVWAGLLSAQGKALFDFLVWDDGDDLLIDCEAAQADALARRLTLYRLRRAVTIVRDEALTVHWSPSGGQGVADPRLEDLGRRWIAAAGDGDASAAWRAHRLALGVTEGAAEIGQDSTLWLEANAAELNGVSFTKGCYVGQENTARMNWRSNVSRRLIVFRAVDDPGGDARIWYPELGLAVARRRVDSLADGPDLVRPPWLIEAIRGG